MNITTRTSLMGFLLALSALQISAATAATRSSSQNTAQPTVEARLARLTAAIRDRETQLPDTQAATQFSTDLRVAIGWADGSRGGQWTDGALGRGTASGPGGGNWTNGAYGRGTASGPGGSDWTNGAYGRGAASGSNGGSWVNSAYRGSPWVNGGTFANASPWHNTWADGGGFYNHY
ncbi:MAG TPA: GrrA/OscA1 family cyclophane-containing rSAM-modified RiPP [Allocoleopsis sp.]